MLENKSGIISETRKDRGQGLQVETFRPKNHPQSHLLSFRPTQLLLLRPLYYIHRPNTIINTFYIMLMLYSET